MKKSKKIALFVSLDESLLNQIKNFKEHISLEGVEFHFFHCHKIQVYMNELSLYSYPGTEQFDEMEKATNQVLENLASEIGIKNVRCTTVFDSDPKDRAVKFLKDIDADLAIVSTKDSKGIEGLFESSFANHLKKYAPSDILIIRPRK